MTLSRLKSILILFLAALAVYQTGLLWFVNITNRNFLLNYFPFLHQATIPEGADRLIIPWRIIAIQADGTINAQYNSLAGSETYGHRVLSQLLQNGRFIAANYNPSSYFPYPAYIYEYAFPMDAEWFTKGFGQRSNVLTRTGLSPFRQVIIQPPAPDGPAAPDRPADANDYAHVFFLCENGYVYEFAVAPPDGMDTYRHTVSLQGPYYTLGPGGFTRKSLPPEIMHTNPYADDHGFFSMDFIQVQVSGFFSNPAAIRTTPREDVWVYRDVNTVVRYYVTNILEYVSYRAIDRTMPSSFVDDFAAAVLFVERDTLVNNEIYLADFRELDGRHIFYFNYVIGNMPLPAGWHDNLPYPIVVTVDHSTVVRYLKLAYNFHVI